MTDGKDPLGTYVAVAQSAMDHELVRSDRRRVLALIGLLVFFLVVMVSIRSLPQVIRADFRSRAMAAFVPMVAVVVVYLAYEVGVLAWLSRLSRERRSAPAAFRYTHTLIEISLPTATLLAVSPALGGLPTLIGAVPFVYFPFLCLAALSLNYRLCVFAGAAAAAEFTAVSLALIRMDVLPLEAESPVLAMVRSPHQWLVKGGILLATGFIAGFVARQIRCQLASALRTLEERDRAVSIFGQHVSPQVADLLLKQPLDSAAQERHVCVMFFDIRDFSSLANQRPPGEVMEYLNVLFSAIIPIVNEHQGIINKFLGDGFMAVFGAPVADGEQCRHAVDAAQAILACVDQLNRAQSIPATLVGIGLHQGVALTGNVGGGKRKEYTVIGDVVNVAARIEQATKQFRASLLVSEAVAQSIRDPAAVDLGPVELKGQAAPLRLYRLA